MKHSEILSRVPSDAQNYPIRYTPCSEPGAVDFRIILVGATIELNTML